MPSTRARTPNRPIKSNVESELADYHKRFETGDLLAVLDCLVICKRKDHAIPNWARDKLARAAWRFLAGNVPSIDKALFGPEFGAKKTKPKTGRHANPATERREKFHQQLMFDIVTALKTTGLKGAVLWDRALDASMSMYIDPLGRSLVPSLPAEVSQCPHPTEETLRKTYREMRDMGAKPSQFMPLVAQRLGINLSAQ